MALMDGPRAFLGIHRAPIPELPPGPSQADQIAQAILSASRANGAGDPSMVPVDFGTTLPSGTGIGTDWQSINLPVVATDTLTGGRLTRDFPWEITSGMRTMVPPDDYTQQWLTLNLDDSLVRTMPASRLIRVLAEASPEVSRALWDFLRLCNPGFTVTCYYPGTNRPYPAAQNALKAFHRTVNARRHSSLNTVISKLYFNAYLRGAMFTECVLDIDARSPLDIVVPDAASVRFVRDIDPVYGDVWLMGQWQGASFVPLERPTIVYLPVDPAPGIPYGRSPAMPAIFASLFLLAMLHDIRRVIQQQGYPRLDVSVDLDKLRTGMPAQITADPKRWLSWVQRTVDTVKDAFFRLKPDQAFVHTQVVTVNRPVGALDAASLGAVPAIIEALERMIARALKTMPLLMGNNGAGNEANSNRQWEIEVAGIKSVQDLGATVLGRVDEVALEAQGIAADVLWEFAEIRDAAAFRQAQTQQVQDANAAYERDQGWIGQDEAAQKAVGHDAVGDPPPVPVPPPGTGTNTPPGGEKPNPEMPRPQAGGPDNKDTADSKDPNANRIVGDQFRHMSRRGLHWARPPWVRTREREPLA